jgi:hypothetical protein
MEMKRSILLCLLLAGCGGHVAAPSEVIHEAHDVVLPGKCPDDATYGSLKASRPVPLRDQAMPKDPDVRVARQGAQLGKYEAPGAWSDQAWAAIDNCHSRDLAPAP